MIRPGQGRGPAMQRTHRGVHPYSGLGQQGPEIFVQIPAAHAKRRQRRGLKLPAHSHKTLKLGGHEQGGHVGGRHA